MELLTHKRIYDLLLSAQNPVLVSDVRLDGDSLGSVLAMYHFLHQHGKPSRVYVAEAVPEQYQFLPDVHVCSTDAKIFDDSTIDLVVVFDCSEAEFVTSLVERVDGNPMIINIDHHKTNPKYGHVNQVLVDAPATAEVVFRFLEANNVVITKHVSTCLLAGLCFDTNMFSNSATNERALDTASQLILHGARVQDVIRTMFQNRSVSALHVWGAALERLTDHPEIRVMTTVLTRSDIETHQVTDDEIDGLSNFLNLVADTDTLFVLRETKEGGVKVSMRSRTKDVSKIASAHGGGGHAKAAGFTLPDASLVENESVWCVSREERVHPIAHALRFEEFFSV
ncbi:MAG: DHH family phosphoesterase [Candidatus Uhrbacteria bacterium]|nr:DHH family phosphoesterase [Candidatus Uhrbacteria bacterium]